MAVESTSIGKKVRQIRKENNLPQKAFASLFNMSQQNLSRYENGKFQIPYNDLMRIAEHFHISMEYFFDMESSEFSSEERLLVYYFRFLGEKYRQAFLAFLRTVSMEEDGEEQTAVRQQDK